MAPVQPACQSLPAAASTPGLGFHLGNVAFTESAGGRALSPSVPLAEDGLLLRQAAELRERMPPKPT
jgi:hypothetical protein